ncbi:MAG: hypothetical protein KBD56_01655 [Candidatus Eisenbacteria bacterium]|nr:hypothetical protein [Candidatus Eisenbacteria bacterium]
MPIRDRIVWSGRNPFADPRLSDLPSLIRGFKRGDSRGWHTEVFQNREATLPDKGYGHYREYHVGPRHVTGSLRIVLGRSGEVYVSGNHYDDFRQVIGVFGI